MRTVDIVIPTLQLIRAKKVGREARKLSGLDEVRVLCVVDTDRQGFTKTVNRGLAQSRPESDICILNDDVGGFPQDWLKDLQEALYRADRYGISGPSGKSHTAPASSGKPGMTGLQVVKQLPFWCVVVKREMLNRLGFLDERFIHYGSDNYYCYTALKKRWYCVWVKSVFLVHRHKGSGHQSSWMKRDHELLRKVMR